MPASSLYWIQKSASRISAAAANRRRAASPLLSLPCCPLLMTSCENSVVFPRAAMPAPATVVASPFLRKDRRLLDLNGRDGEFGIGFTPFLSARSDLGWYQWWSARRGVLRNTPRFNAARM